MDARLELIRINVQIAVTSNKHDKRLLEQRRLFFERLLELRKAGGLEATHGSTD